MISGNSTVGLQSAGVAALIGRLCLSMLFLVSGVGKLLAPAATVAAIDSAGLPFPPAGFLLTVGVEVLGGSALLVGFKVRWAAAVLAAFTATTAILFHSDFSDPNQITQFLKNVSIAGGLLYAVAFGDRSGT